MTKYRQCRMYQPNDRGRELLVGFIEECAAQVGSRVEVKGRDGLFTVEEVYGPPVEGADVSRRQAQVHGGWGSLR